MTVWLETAPAEIRTKLEKVGLIQQPRRFTLSQLWDDYIAEVADDREWGPSTFEKYNAVRLQFFAYFKANDPMESLTKESLQNWKQFLAKTYRTAHGKPLAPTTITGSIAKIKAICNWATDERGLFAKSPAASLKGSGYVNKERSFFIDREMFEKLLAECRTQEERTILTLARIGGLRIPSELVGLTWADVLWTRDRFLVKSPRQCLIYPSCTEREKSVEFLL